MANFSTLANVAPPSWRPSDNDTWVQRLERNVFRHEAPDFTGYPVSPWMPRRPDYEMAEGRIYDPTAPEWAPQVAPYRIDTAPPRMDFSDTGFAQYLRRAPSLAELLMWWGRR